MKKPEYEGRGQRHGYRQLHGKPEYILKILQEMLIKDLIVERPLPIRKKNKKRIGLMKDELGRKIMKEIVVWRPKMCSCLMDDSHVDKRSKNTKKSVKK